MTKRFEDMTMEDCWNEHLDERKFAQKVRTFLHWNKFKVGEVYEDENLFITIPLGVLTLWVAGNSIHIMRDGESLKRVRVRKFTDLPSKLSKALRDALVR